MEIKVGCDGDRSTAVQGDVGTATAAVSGRIALVILMTIMQCKSAEYVAR